MNKLVEQFFNMPVTYAPTCDWPNCKNAMIHGIAGTTSGDIDPSQWCDEHYKIVSKKSYNWMRKFQNGKLKNMPEDKRKIKVYAW